MCHKELQKDSTSPLSPFTPVHCLGPICRSRVAGNYKIRTWRWRFRQVKLSVINLRSLFYLFYAIQCILYFFFGKTTQSVWGPYWYRWSSRPERAETYEYAGFVGDHHQGWISLGNDRPDSPNIFIRTCRHCRNVFGKDLVSFWVPSRKSRDGNRN